MRSLPPTHKGLCLSAQMPPWGKELPRELWSINNSLRVIHNLCLIMGGEERRRGGREAARRTQRVMGEQMREREEDAQTDTSPVVFVVSSARFHILMPAVGKPRDSVGFSQSKHSFLSRNQQSLSRFRPSWPSWCCDTCRVPYCFCLFSYCLVFIWIKSHWV